MAKENPYIIQSVDRALSLLEAVAIASGPVTAKQLADDQELSLPTTYHLLSTLVLRGYLRKEGRSYQFATKISELHEAFEQRRSPGLVIQALMHRVAEVTGETAYISTWQHGDVSIAAVAEGNRAVRVAGVMVGLRGHAHARASGKVLLAFGPPMRRERYLAGSLEPLTPQTICDRGELGAILDQVRADGYAVDREEFTAGVCCVSAPVLEGESTTDALTVTMPAHRFEDEKQSIVETLLDAVRAALASAPIGPGTR
jgi:IclR family acetate operon transcriptional repressor